MFIYQAIKKANQLQKGSMWNSVNKLLLLHRLGVQGVLLIVKLFKFIGFCLVLVGLKLTVTVL